MTIQQYIIQQTGLSLKAVENTVRLLEEGSTLPFIARYRKEQTGNLDEVQIQAIIQYKEQYETLEKRKETILKAIAEQGALNKDLESKIKGIFDATTLEDVYLPYKKKRKTKAETARKNGLEPLAKIIMTQRDNQIERTAQKFINQEVKTTEEALQGAKYIIAEWVNERSDIRQTIRQQLERFSVIETKVVTKKKEEDEAQKYRDYFEWNESLHRCPSHRLLAILRAEKEGFIRLKISIDDEKALHKIERKFIRSNNVCSDIITDAIADSYKRLLYPSLSNERLKTAKEKADQEAINVFSKNLKQLLLAAPLGEKRILALDPGFRTGCKVVCLSEQGDLLYHTAIYPHPPQRDTTQAGKTIKHLVGEFKIEAIAIGNGTASRETEQFVRKLNLAGVEIFMVNEAGASIYSASKIARQEFPNEDVTVRGAVSIGRRLSDPLAELVKIDPKSIGVGQYQHDVNQSQLKLSLDQVVGHCVNSVGVNVNTASVPLLSYVSGIGEKLAENIVAYRNEMGGFTNRNQIKKVPRLGAKAFEQSIAFLRIKNAKNPLDDSAVHPESYPVVKQILQGENLSLETLIGNKSALQAIDINKYIQGNVGLPTLQDIIKELEKPGVDIREKAKAFAFSDKIQTIDDVQNGQILPGIINNITNFGCFVDIGIKESGLIHISNLSDTFVKDVSQVVHLQEQVTVEVIGVDYERKRIQLKRIT